MSGTQSDAGEQGEVALGTDLERNRDAMVPVALLRKHKVSFGTTGSGKTTTEKRLLYELWERHKIPFLALESTKGEYRSLLLGGEDWARSVRVFTPGNEALSPVSLNPIEITGGRTRGEQAASVEECFAGALPMGGPLQNLIGEAIERAYELAGIDEFDEGQDCSTFPTMDDLLSASSALMATRSYEGKVKGNLEEAVKVRLASLCRGNIGRMFRCERTLPTINDLISNPTIIELERLSLDQKNLFSLFLLTAVWQAVRELGPTDQLRLVFLIGEAHNLIGVGQNRPVAAEEADPRGFAARLIVRMLAEVRAYGVGIVLEDQSPSALAPEVLVNTAVKLAHLTQVGKDRALLGDCMLMDDVSVDGLARLRPGEAYLIYPGLYRPDQDSGRPGRGFRKGNKQRRAFREIVEFQVVLRASARAPDTRARMVVRQAEKGARFASPTRENQWCWQ